MKPVRPSKRAAMYRNHTQYPARRERRCECGRMFLISNSQAAKLWRCDKCRKEQP